MSGHFFELIKEKAEDGDSYAQVLLGNFYYTGFQEGIKQDFSEAAKWYRKSAEQGDSEGMYCLGQLYFTGEGVDKNINESKNWLLKSEKLGNQKATEFLKRYVLYEENVLSPYRTEIPIITSNETEPQTQNTALSSNSNRKTIIYGLIAIFLLGVITFFVFKQFVKSEPPDRWIRFAHNDNKEFYYNPAYINKEKHRGIFIYKDKKE